MTQDYPKKTINYLTSDNTLLNTYNTDATAGIASYPNTISKKVVTQDENGRWSEQYVEQECRRRGQWRRFFLARARQYHRPLRRRKQNHAWQQ